MVRRVVSLVTLLLIAFGTAKAETLTASVLLNPANENPPITGLNAAGAFEITINVTRDAQGAVTAGTIRFLGAFSFPGAVTVTGLHIHEGAATVNGSVRFDSGISGASPREFTTGVGFIDITIQNVNVEVLKRLLANPAGFYVNLHTTVNGGGAIRGQIVKLVETFALTVPMSTANEVPPVTDEMASGVGTITIHPIRNPDTGAITGGNVIFSITHDLLANSTITGLHIHEQVAGMNGSVVINTGINSTNNSITLPTGKGSLAINVPLAGASRAAMQRLLQNPTGFYVNLHTVTKGGGLIRGQLTALAAPPVIQQASTYFLPTGAQDASVKLLITGLDLTGSLLINGQTAVATPDLTSGMVTLTVPASSLANPGTLWVQARNNAGLLSNLVGIVVSNNVNPVAATATDAARFGFQVAPDSIASVFGTSLSTTGIGATAQPLPIQLDGTLVYVNGVAAPLLAVTPLQVNFVVPAGTLSGPATVVVVNKNGLVSRGTVNVAPTIPAIFTSKADGTGAPAAVASRDGGVFNLSVGSPDGSALPIDAGNYVAIFGTGFRYASAAATVTIGSTAVTPLYVGPQGSLAGSDQLNLQIPQSLVGRGLVDLIITVDGKTSNAVKLNIR